jgi:Kef-type K+ transport system membrane component KefB/predicted amino acid-binding ACT domain protein
VDVNRILLDILVVLLAAKIAAELADRVSVPAVVGEIVAGILIGPSALGWVHSSQALSTLAELGVILLLLEVGLEMDLGELASVGRASVLVAIVGVTFPLLGGALVGLGLGMSGKEAVFVGAALTATSVGITARVFGDLRALASVEAKTVLGAAIADDILGLVILTVVTRIVTEGSVSPLGILWVVVVAVGFVVITTAVGVRVVPHTFVLIQRHSRSAGTLVALAFAFTLAIAELANAAKLAPIVGAFVAGIALSRSGTVDRVRSELAPVAHLLVPVFFLQIGIDVQIGEFARWGALRLAAALLVVAIAGKLISVLGLIGSPGDRLLVGIGMIPRGEVGLIFATLGLRQHVFGQDTYAALLIVVLLTTVGTPPALRWRLLKLRQHRKTERVAQAGSGAVTVSVGPSGTVELEGEPLPAAALAIALRAARLCAQAPPGAGLLEWIDAFPPGPRKWDPDSLAELWPLLAESDARSWRLLTASSVLQRALPELDDALARRGRDRLDLDPLATFTFPRLAGLRDGGAARGQSSHDRSLLIAALVLDACEGAPVQPIVVARRVVQRLDLGAGVEQAVAALVGDANLLVAGARRLDGLDEEAVLQLSVHLGEIDRARALYELTVASMPEDRALRERVDALYGLVIEAVSHPEIVGREAANETERRKSEAATLVSNPAVRDRIAVAPRGYVLSLRSIDIARHASMCEPRPGSDEVRVLVGREGDEWVVDVVARDRVGLVACASSAFAQLGCVVVHAVIAVWGDGMAVSSYRMTSDTAPDADAVVRLIRQAFDEPTATTPIADVVFDFDNQASPWYTLCTAVGADRPGLLRGLASAFAAANVNVHAARIATDGGTARDSFDLTDKRGAKLDERAMAAISEALERGSEPKRHGVGSWFRSRRSSTGSRA